MPELRFRSSCEFRFPTLQNPQTCDLRLAQHVEHFHQAYAARSSIRAQGRTLVTELPGALRMIDEGVEANICLAAS
jgi:hypothetical protein